MTVSAVEIQLIPEFLLGTKKRETVVLESGKSVSLDAGVDRIALHFDWTYQPELGRFDVDSAVALFTDNFSVHDFVWWDNPVSSCESVRFSSDDDLGNEHGRETISMALKKIPRNVRLIATAVSVYAKDHSMHHLQTVGMNIHTNGGEHLAGYQVWFGALSCLLNY